VRIALTRARVTVDAATLVGGRPIRPPKQSRGACASARGS
jgi:hypothetical protein